MPFLGGEISEELETLIDEEVKRSEKSKSVNPEVRHAIEPHWSSVKRRIAMRQRSR